MGKAIYVCFMECSVVSAGALHVFHKFISVFPSRQYSRQLTLQRLALRGAIIALIALKQLIGLNVETAAQQQISQREELDTVDKITANKTY